MAVHRRATPAIAGAPAAALEAGLESHLESHLEGRRWFGGKARTLAALKVVEAIPVGGSSWLSLIAVTYTEGEPEVYLLPLAAVWGEAGRKLERELAHEVIARFDRGRARGILFDAVRDAGFRAALLAAIRKRRTFKGSAGELVACPLPCLRRIEGKAGAELASAVLGVEQSNTSLVYGDRLLLKLFRRVREGVNPDLEIGRFLCERTSFKQLPPVAGFLEYRARGAEPMTIGILQGYVKNQGDAWSYTLEALGRSLERVRARRRVSPPAAPPREPLVALAGRAIPSPAGRVLGRYLKTAQLLGRRTAEMHRALGSSAADPSFAAEPFTLRHQRSLHRSLKDLAARVLRLLRKRLRELPAEIQEDGRKVLELEAEIDRRLRSIAGRKLTALRIRCHGDYHLGQLLYTGRDFVVIDFEGEPARSLSERRTKLSPLKDVAGMLRSFHYAAHAALAAAGRTGSRAALEAWAHSWHRWAGAAFLRSYLEAARGAAFLPRAPDEIEMLLEVYLLEKAVYELGYELDNRPAWIRIPLAGILELLEGGLNTAGDSPILAPR